MQPNQRTQPKASIVIPAFNAERYIEPTLRSIFDSGIRTPFEIIVVDDGSTDQTKTVVERFNDIRVSLISIPNFGGPSRPRNVGIQHAKGEYIFIFDSDDIMLPGKIDKSVDLLDSTPSAGFLFTNFQTIGPNGQLINPSFLETYDSLYDLPHRKVDEAIREIGGNTLLRGLSTANFIGTSSVAIRRSALEVVGGFDEHLKNGDDYNLWVRLSLEYSALFLDHHLHQYRIHESSISKSNPTKRLENLIRLHKKHCTREFPNDFVQASRRKVGQYSFILSKMALKNGENHQAQIYAKDAIRHNYSPARASLIFGVSALPKKITALLVKLRQ